MRFMATSNPPELTMDVAKAITQMTIMQLDNEDMMYNQSLKKIQKTNASLTDRWQAMVHVLLSCQLHAIVPFGYQPNEQGLLEFNKAFGLLTMKPEGKELRKLSLDRWRMIVNHAFGVVMGPEDSISVEKARLIALKLSFEMLSEPFLKSIDQAVENLGPSPSDLQRQQALLQALLPLQMRVMSEFGFQGEEGFIRLQIAQAEHATDETVAHNTVSSTMAVFRRAGIRVGQ